MNQRKVVIVPVNRVVGDSKTTPHTLAPFGEHETNTLLSYLRAPKAFFAERERFSVVLPMSKFLEHPEVDGIFGQSRCGVSRRATVQDVLDGLQNPTNWDGKRFVNGLISKELGIDYFAGPCELVSSDKLQATFSYLAVNDLMMSLRNLTTVITVEESFQLPDLSTVTWGALTEELQKTLHQQQLQPLEERKQWRELFIQATPVGVYHRTPFNPVPEFTPGVRYEIMLELVRNPTLVKEIYLAAYRELAAFSNDIEFHFTDFLTRLGRRYEMLLPTGQQNVTAVNWECSDHVKTLTDLLSKVFWFDELQERNQKQTVNNWRYGIGNVFSLVLAILPEEQREFYNQYTISPFFQGWTGMMKFGSAEEADRAAERYKQILDDVDNVELTLHYL